MAAITTARDKVRLLIGDTDEDSALFTDDELDYFLSERADQPMLAAADACDALARRFARKPDFTTDNQAFKWSHVAKQYADLAVSLRARAGGISTASTTRIDGYSQDIDSHSVLEADTSPRRRYWGDRDVPY